MIQLLNNSQKTYKFTMTNNPITKVQQSPRPTGIDIETLDPENDKAKIEKILKNENYSTAEEVVLKPGINKYENEEHAEYLYKTLGAPEEGGVTIIGSGKTRSVTNNNFVLEVDGEGKETKDHFFKKYRQPVGMVTHTEIDPELCRLKPEPSV